MALLSSQLCLLPLFRKCNLPLALNYESIWSMEQTKTGCWVVIDKVWNCVIFNVLPLFSFPLLRLEQIYGNEDFGYAFPSRQKTFHSSVMVCVKDYYIRQTSQLRSFYIRLVFRAACPIMSLRGILQVVVKTAAYDIQWDCTPPVVNEWSKASSKMCFVKDQAWT